MRRGEVRQRAEGALVVGDIGVPRDAGGPVVDHAEHQGLASGAGPQQADPERIEEAIVFCSAGITTAPARPSG